MSNPVFHFEIPVTDMDRAVAFYRQVLGFDLTRRSVDGYEMAFFPRDDLQPGASGALVCGDVYRPSHDGTLIYFDVEDIDAVLQRATACGSQILYEKKHIGEAGFVAEFEDCEGNRIALTQANS
ncbi:MAG: VOC family protein [Pseudomonadota bacterium]